MFLSILPAGTWAYCSDESAGETMYGVASTMHRRASPRITSQTQYWRSWRSGTLLKLRRVNRCLQLRDHRPVWSTGVYGTPLLKQVIDSLRGIQDDDRVSKDIDIDDVP